MHQNIDHLSETSRELFNQYVPTIFKAPGKVKMFIVLLESLDFRETIKAEIEVTGLLVTTPSGIKRSNPLLTDLQKAESTFVKLASQLKLSGEIEFDMMSQEYYLSR